MRKAFFSFTKIISGLHTGSIGADDLDQGIFCMQRSREHAYVPTDLREWAEKKGIAGERATELHRYALLKMLDAENEGRVIFAGSEMSLTYGLFDLLLVYAGYRGIFVQPFLKANKHGLMKPVRRSHQIDFNILGEMLAASGIAIENVH